jgi:hypothetical protein
MFLIYFKSLFLLLECDTIMGCKGCSIYGCIECDCLKNFILFNSTCICSFGYDLVIGIC